MAVPASVGADNGTDSSALREAVTASGILGHLEELQAFATANSGTRSAGTGGHEASAAYVAGLLDGAGYNVTLQEFSYEKWTQLAPASFSVEAAPYSEGTDFAVMSYSGSATGSGAVQPIDLLLPPVGGSTSGCEDADFDGFVAGDVALIQRGTCTFYEKALNAQEAKASAVIIFNEGNTDRTDLLFGTLGADGTKIMIPVIGTTFAVGQVLAAGAGVSVSITVSAEREEITTYNVLADTPTGRTDRIVVAGGHLDSVAEGPGINDNGSGTMTLLEVALQMAALEIEPRNMVRFAFWSGEEDGLIGSQYYVDQLSARDVKNHALNLNFDMIGSPNGGRFIYDGDGSDSTDAGPNGSAVIESVFADYFVTQSLATAPTAFDGRSDYGPFIDRGIPAGGLFTGAEDIKSAGEAELFGGTAGLAFDPCYHQACDTITNIDEAILGQMAGAVAHAVLTFAQTTSAVNGTGKGSSDTIDFLRQGSHYIK